MDNNDKELDDASERSLKSYFPDDEELPVQYREWGTNREELRYAGQLMLILAEMVREDVATIGICGDTENQCDHAIEWLSELTSKSFEALYRLNRLSHLSQLPYMKPIKRLLILANNDIHSGDILANEMLESDGEDSAIAYTRAYIKRLFDEYHKPLRKWGSEILRIAYEMPQDGPVPEFDENGIREYKEDDYMVFESHVEFEASLIGQQSALHTEEPAMTEIQHPEIETINEQCSRKRNPKIEKRDKLFFEQKKSGLTVKDIQVEWNRTHQHDTISEAAIRQAISRAKKSGIL